MFNLSKKLGKKYLKKQFDRVLTLTGSSIWLPAGKYIKQSALSLLPKPIQPTAHATEMETFANAMARYGLTDADLRVKQQRLIIECLFYLVLAIVVFFYGCYMMMSRHWSVFFASAAITMMLFTFAFRAHFWLFQLKTRTLGCSLQDWWHYVLRGSK